MPAPIIRVEGLGKRYRLRHQAGQDYVALRDVLAEKVRAIGRGLTGRGAGAATENEEFWALRDVAFDVQQGEVVGIIGRNGAGKSTLLKILSRITEPTEGRVHIRGRVASLLEVGTGFHPELSGRENIFLNGAILGMRRAEIARKFDEIVAFADVERFLDTPVKHYSSGMYVRLAFAVAAHLEPEILIVDEVLAVGDAAFQKKCLGKMSSVASREGRTVLFVSHNLQSVRNLCRSAILLSTGRVSSIGKCARVLEDYERGLAGTELAEIPPPPRELVDRAFVVSAAVETDDGGKSSIITLGRGWRIRVVVRIASLQERFFVAVGLVAADGSPVQTAWTVPGDFAPGDYEFTFHQDRVILESGSYSVLIGLNQQDRALQQITATIVEITSESAIGFYPSTAGIGRVLNSMRSEYCRL